jgi:hypothetical protein
MKRKSLDERKKVLPNQKLLDLSEKRISYDSKLQNEIIHVLEK